MLKGSEDEIVDINKMRLTYQQAGVDVRKIRKTQTDIGNMIKETFVFQNIGKVITGFGHYSGLIEIGSSVFALHTDGVGTKLIIAQKMGIYHTVGIDCIAMNVNDIICVGAKPFGFVDYIALKSLNKKLVQEIMEGLVLGAKMAKTAIIGGETAIVPDLLSEKQNVFDLAGTAFGIGKKNKLILGDKIQEEDLIFGLESNGLHSNGYTLARKVLTKLSLDKRPKDWTLNLGEELLAPTYIYVGPIMELLEKKIKISGLANITGGAFTKLKRLNERICFNLNNLPEPRSQIFNLIQHEGKITSNEMYKTFNMGIGFCIIAPKESEESIMKIVKKYKIKSYQIGKTSKKRNASVVASIQGKRFVLQK